MFGESPLLRLPSYHVRVNCQTLSPSCTQPRWHEVGPWGRAASMMVIAHGSCSTCLTAKGGGGWGLPPASRGCCQRCWGVSSDIWDPALSSFCRHCQLLAWSAHFCLLSFEPGFPALLEILAAFNNFLFCLNQKSTYIREMQIQTTVR